MPFLLHDHMAKALRGHARLRDCGHAAHPPGRALKHRQLRRIRLRDAPLHGPQNRSWAVKDDWVGAKRVAAKLLAKNSILEMAAGRRGEMLAFLGRTGFYAEPSVRTDDHAGAVPPGTRRRKPRAGSRQARRYRAPRPTLQSLQLPSMAPHAPCPATHAGICVHRRT